MRMFFMLVIMMMMPAFAMAQEKYGFKVAGVDVTSDNYLDLTEINGVSGKVYFDPNTRALTLDNATIEVDTETKKSVPYIPLMLFFLP